VSGYNEAFMSLLYIIGGVAVCLLLVYLIVALLKPEAF
jgi:K+-transporting ATPase KdpF subunit